MRLGRAADRTPPAGGAVPAFSKPKNERTLRFLYRAYVCAPAFDLPRPAWPTRVYAAGAGGVCEPGVARAVAAEGGECGEAGGGAHGGDPGLAAGRVLAPRYVRSEAGDRERVPGA